MWLGRSLLTTWLTLATAVAASSEVRWHTDYATAHAEAEAQRRLLVINFVDPRLSAQAEFESYLAAAPLVRDQLQQCVCLRLPCDAAGDLLYHRSFWAMSRLPGLAIVDLANAGQEQYRTVVSAYPFAVGKYYRWQADYLPSILALPAGTLTQRTMVWAVRIHPEQPQSTSGAMHPTLARGADDHSRHQAAMCQQGHHHFGYRYRQLRAATGADDISEVCAESWPRQGLLDSCLDCVRSWRHSPGHWRGVASRCRIYGYDICQGRNGIWYGTGLFGN